MSWLGELVGEIAGAIFPGAKAIVTKAVDRAVVVVVNAGRAFIEEWSKSPSLKSRGTPEATTKAQRDAAEELAEKEKYFAEKFKRDGHRKSSDADQIEEIERSRDALRKEMGETNAIDSAQEIATAENLISKPVTGDEIAAQIGILSTKECPSCGGIMTLQFDARNNLVGQKFKWLCTAHPLRCRLIYVTENELKRQISVRQPDSDLDASEAERKSWNDQSLAAKTAGRVRMHLGDEDKAILCPKHLLPMKLLPLANSSGAMLDSLQYTCMGVDDTGKACSHTVPVKSWGQVSSLLNRIEGRGIL
jgi:hypothetical protein